MEINDENLKQRTPHHGTNNSFALLADTLREGAVVGRFGLRIYANYLDLLLDGGVQYNNDITDIDVHLTARTVF